VRHHQEADGLQPEVARDVQVLDGDVGVGAVRGDAGDRDAEVRDRPQVVDRADAGQQEIGDPRVPGGLHRGPDELRLRRV
jgi:hypothetical protein